MMKTTAALFTLALCALLAVAPLLINSGFFLGGWDLSLHLYNAFQVSAGIKEGLYYPRWLPLFNGGYGEPVTIFYSPLFYIFTGIVNLFSPSLLVALKIVTFSSFLLSGVFMFLFLRNFCNHIGSLAGGIAYQLLPYHLFDLYARRTLTESLAFFWFPLILYFVYKGTRENSLSHWIGMAFSYAGLVLTHIVSAYLFSVVIAAYILFLSIMNKDYRVVIRGIFASLFGLSLAAVYFLPMFFERKFVHIAWLNSGPWTFENNFLYMKDKRHDPFYVQVEHMVMLLVLSVLLSLLLNYYHRKMHGVSSNHHQLMFLVMVFSFSIFISTPLSMPLWELIPGLSTTQFPWRWLMISTFAAAALIGISFDSLSFPDIMRNRTTMVTAVFFHAILIVHLYASSSYLRLHESMLNRDLDRICSSGVDLVEYRPIWLADQKKDFSEEKGKAPVVFTKGEGIIEIVDWKSQSRRIRATASTASTLRISTFYYPGWTALTNGSNIPIDIEKDSGAMLLSVPAGEYSILLQFRDTPLRNAAKWISILSFVAAFLGLLRGVINKRRKAYPQQAHDHT